MERRAVYAGSFDPPTHGHFDVIRKMAPLFDVIHVVVAHNSRKKTLFTPSERVNLVQEGVAALKIPGKVQVHAHDGLVADFAQKHGAKYLVRGLRALSDYENELQIATMNRKLGQGDLETVLIMADEKHFFVSSSLVKEIAHHGGPLNELVPTNVETALKQKISQEGGPKK
jgi:pantetheine-phosphate adenylyltransferase